MLSYVDFLFAILLVSAVYERVMHGGAGISMTLAAVVSLLYFALNWDKGLYLIKRVKSGFGRLKRIINR